MCIRDRLWGGGENVERSWGSYSDDEFEMRWDGSAQRQTIHEERGCLLYTSDAADERSSVDLGGRRIIKKKKRVDTGSDTRSKHQ